MRKNIVLNLNKKILFEVGNPRINYLNFFKSKITDLPVINNERYLPECIRLY